MSPGGEREARAAREVTQRAIRRLDLFEGVLFFGGALFALAGGAAIAWILAGIAGLHFRTVWVVASLVLFVVPGFLAIMRIRREEAADLRKVERAREQDDG